MDGANASLAASSGDAANESHQSANHPDASSSVGNSSGVSEPSESDRLLTDISTARADNPVNPTAPPAESGEDNRATLSACTDRSAANPPEG